MKQYSLSTIIIGLVVAVIQFVLGGVFLEYVIYSCFGRTVPFLIAGVLGLFTTPLNGLAALVCLVLRLVGMHVPFFHVH